MVEEIEARRRPLNRWERNVINKAYVFGLGRKDLPYKLSLDLENIYFGRVSKFYSKEKTA